MLHMWLNGWTNKPNQTKPNQTSNTLLPDLYSTVDNDSKVTIWTTFLLHKLIKIRTEILNLTFVSSSPYFYGSRIVQSIKWLSNQSDYLQEDMGLFFIILSITALVSGQLSLQWMPESCLPMASNFGMKLTTYRDMWWSNQLGHCTNQKVTGLIRDGVIEIFHWLNPSGCTVVLGWLSL